MQQPDAPVWLVILELRAHLAWLEVSRFEGKMQRVGSCLAFLCCEQLVEVILRFSISTQYAIRHTPLEADFNLRRSTPQDLVLEGEPKASS